MNPTFYAVTHLQTVYDGYGCDGIGGGTHAVAKGVFGFVRADDRPRGAVVYHFFVRFLRTRGRLKPKRTFRLLEFVSEIPGSRGKRRRKKLATHPGKVRKRKIAGAGRWTGRAEPDNIKSIQILTHHHQLLRYLTMSAKCSLTRRCTHNLTLLFF